jgi:hypothetical protein
MVLAIQLGVCLAEIGPHCDSFNESVSLAGENAALRKICGKLQHPSRLPQRHPLITSSRIAARQNRPLPALASGAIMKP